MNSIQQAFAKAGVKPKPAKLLVWNWLKDHPDTVTGQIIAALKGAASAVAIQKCLQGMRRDGQIISARVKVPSKNSTRAGSTLRHRVVGKEFTDAPRSKIVVPEIRNSLTVPNPVAGATQTCTAHAGPTTLQANKLNIESLTLREARELYNALHELFGRTK